MLYTVEKATLTTYAAPYYGCKDIFSVLASALLDLAISSIVGFLLPLESLK